MENEKMGKMKSGLMLGVNSNAIREENDFYATNPHAMEIAIPILREIGIHNKIGELYRDWETDRKSTRLNSSHSGESRMPSSA